MRNQQPRQGRLVKFVGRESVCIAGDYHVSDYHAILLKKVELCGLKAVVQIHDAVCFRILRSCVARLGLSEFRHAYIVPGLGGSQAQASKSQRPLGSNPQPFTRPTGETPRRQFQRMSFGQPNAFAIPPSLAFQMQPMQSTLQEA